MGVVQVPEAHPAFLESLPRLGSDRLQAGYSLRSPCGPHCVRYSAALRSYSGFVASALVARSS